LIIGISLLTVISEVRSTEERRALLSVSFIYFNDIYFILYLLYSVPGGTTGSVLKGITGNVPNGI
jgi:hypothetical protein